MNRTRMCSKKSAPVTKLVSALATLTLLTCPFVALAASTGTTQLYMPENPSAALEYGDFISNAAGLDSNYIYWIEVPPGTGSLVIQVFDADYGNSATEDVLGRDEELTGNFGGNSCTYSVFSPVGATGTQVGSDLSLSQANTSLGLTAATAENSWQTVHRSGTTPVVITNPTAGHWRLVVNTVGSTNNESVVNAFGVRAHDGTPGAGGTELNVYSDAFSMYGLNGDGANGIDTRQYIEYPYITSGCNCLARNFDMDSVGTVTLAAPNLFSAGTSVSGNNAWVTSSISGFADFGQVAGRVAQGYGLWTRTVLMRTYGLNGNTQNYSNFYTGAFNYATTGATNPPAADAPSTTPPTDKFRVYLPTDAGAMPLKPTSKQFIRNIISGPNPPTANNTTIIELEVDVTNPTPFPITFSATNVVTARIPSPRVTFVNPSVIVSQGTFTQPANNATNANLTWNPGIVASGATASMRYRVRVTPTAANQVTNVTDTPASGNGTRMRFIDETGNATQARALLTFGPLCQLSLTSNNTVLASDVLTLKAQQTGVDQPVIVSWESANEWNNAGYYVYTAQSLPNGQTVPGQQLGWVPAQGGSASGVHYSFSDERPLGATESRGYYVVDVNLNGVQTPHGPAFVSIASGSITTIGDWSVF